MSGHSHFKTIKRVKDANDAKRGKIFSKLARMISVAARDGRDPETNAKLRQALDQAKKFNLPKDNVEKAIKRGTGELGGGEKLEEVLYEGFGPRGTTLILEGITDNKNRTLAEIRQILQKHQGKLADEGSVKYQYEQKGIIVLRITNKYEYTNNKNKEELELKAIEAGAEDTRWYIDDKEEFLEITTSIENLKKVKYALEKQGIEIDSSTLGWVAKTEIDVSEQDRAALDKLFNALDDSDAIQEIYSNLKL